MNIKSYVFKDTKQNDVSLCLKQERLFYNLSEMYTL